MDVGMEVQKLLLDMKRDFELPLQKFIENCIKIGYKIKEEEIKDGT